MGKGKENEGRRKREGERGKEKEGRRMREGERGKEKGGKEKEERKNREGGKRYWYKGEGKSKNSFP